MSSIDYDKLEIKELRVLAKSRGLDVSKRVPSPNIPDKINHNWKTRSELAGELRAQDASDAGKVLSAPASRTKTTVMPAKSAVLPSMPKPGFIYIFTNKSLKPGIVKIGRTGDDPKGRAHGLDGTALPFPFKVYASIQTSKFMALEKTIHGILTTLKKRINPHREFFRLEPEEALKILEEVNRILDDGKIKYGPAAIRARSKHP